MIGESLNIISIGQCGNRIGKKFEELRATVYYINSDSVDMRGLDVAVDKTLLLDGRGTGGSTIKGQQMFKKHKGIVVDFLKESLDKEKVNMVLFGLGGGTGGSLGPLVLDYAIQHKYKTGVLTTLPPKMLGILAGDNALRTLKQIKDIESNFFILVDNELLTNKIGISSNWWERVNAYIVEQINSVFNILKPEKISQSGIGSIDKGEVMRILQFGKGLTDIRVVYLSPYDLRAAERDLILKLFTPVFIEGHTYKNTLAYLVSIDVPERGAYTALIKNIFDATKKISGSAISRLGMFVDPNLSPDVIRVTMVNAGLKLPKVLQSRINNLKRDEQRFIDKKGKEESLDLSQIEGSILDEDFNL